MSKQHIAIVNSDTTLLMLLQELFTEAGYEVAIYLTRHDPYKHLCETQPAGIVLDVGVGVSASGWPLLKLLKFNPQTTHIPILVTTVDPTFVTEKISMLQQQGYDILELPSSFEELQARLERLLTLHES